MFPEKRGFFQWPVGWEDLGQVEDGSRVENGQTIISTEVHGLCKTRLHVGKENNTWFQFCPKCLIKTDNNKKDKKYV